MKSASRKGLFVSCILHTVLFLIITFAFFLNNYSRPKITKHVFQLQNISQKQVKSVVIKNPESIAKVSIIEEKKLEHKVVTKPKEKGIPKNTLSYEDFVKKHKGKEINPSKVVNKTVNVPKIQTKEIKDSLEKRLSVSDTVSVSELMEYESYLYSIIDEAWEYPESFEGYKNGAIFVFDVDKLGQILRIRISKTSGSNTFDESVSRTLNRINRIKPNPHGKTLTFQLTFSKK